MLGLLIKSKSVYQFLLWGVGVGVFFKNVCTGMLKVDFRILAISIPQKVKKCDIVTHHYTKLV